ncbi:MAG: response regulator, partial [Candidatus Dormibacteraceae bacterium]
MISLLIADDDPDHLTLTRLALEEGLDDCLIRTAESGQSVLEACRDQAFDIVLLDYRLPDLDGLTVLAELRRQVKPAPIVILLTGLGSEEVAAAALRLGADDYLPKMGNYTALLPTVVARARQRRHLENLERDVEAHAAIERNKLAFVQSVNHELRTPLTLIVGYSELLARRGCPAEEIAAYCQEIFDQANRLSDLVERLLEAALIEPIGPRGAAVVHRLDVRERVRDVVAGLPAESARRIAVDADPEAFALVNRELFHRALDEVIGNALKFSPPDHPVAVSVVTRGDSVEAWVNDDGPGIPRDER